MNAVMLRAFRSELQKEAAFMRDVGMNIGNTLKGFTTPVQSIKKGWQSGGWMMSGDAPGAGLPLKPGGVMDRISKYLPGAKTMTLASSAAMAPEAFRKEDPAGRSRTERVSRLVGNTAGGLIGTPYGLSGAIAGSILGEVGGGLVGKGMNKLKGKKAPKKEPTQPAPAKLSGPQVK